MIKNIIACILVALSITAGLAHGGEAEIRKGAQELFGQNVQIDAVRKAEALGLYEVQIGTDVIYADEKGEHFVIGNILETKTKKNFTELRKNKLALIKFSDLPLNLAVKTVRGNGKRVFATFEDPNCGYCKKLAKEMVNMTDITMYTFLYPILTPDSTDKSKAIWCAGDPAKAWNKWMVDNETPTAGTCDTPIDKVVALGQKLGVHGTPTIFLTNGERLPGFVPIDRLESELNRVASAK
jgi:thiol:disulfide interchange protein DsbC